MGLLSYKQIGKGTPIVFIHGFCENKQIWDSYLINLLSDFQIISLDLGGFGDSAHLLPQPCSIESLAEQVCDLLQCIKITKAIFVGHSLGGYVALALAEKYPEMIQKLCLFHSTALADSEEKKEIRNKVIDFVQKVGGERYIESFVSPLFCQKRLEELKQEILFVEKIAKKTPLGTIVSVIKAMRDRKSRLNVIREATFPILFIIGKEDGAVSFESYQEQITANPLVETCILEETGHMGMFERPQETLEAIKKFCKN
jgi:pimeloyl-ACP methyl ester carboxylesterase